jgi:hypothetical protein
MKSWREAHCLLSYYADSLFSTMNGVWKCCRSFVLTSSSDCFPHWKKNKKASSVSVCGNSWRTEKQEDGRICSERFPEKKMTQGDSVVVRANLRDKSRGKMTEPDGALRLVAVLATRSRCSESIHLALCKKITLAQLEKIHHHRSFFALLLTPATCCIIIISSSIRPSLQAPPGGAAASSLYAKCSNERKL